MANATRGSGLALRPHAKSHKCPAIALQQVALGAIGICCQKVDEAAAFVDAGIGDVLVTNEVVTGPKLDRLAELARKATVGVLADHLGVVGAISGAATKRASCSTCWSRSTWVHIAAALRRGAPAVALAQADCRTRPDCAFAACTPTKGPRNTCCCARPRRAATADCHRRTTGEHHARSDRGMMGIACPTVTGAGTGTWRCEHDSRGVHGAAAGVPTSSLDADYGRNALAPDDHAFEQALYVVATVMSTPAPDRAIVDAGLKALAFDSGLPLVHAVHGLEYVGASDEHGVLRVDARVAPPVGRRTRLAPAGTLRSDGESLRLDRGGTGRIRVECVWPVVARGALG